MTRARLGAALLLLCLLPLYLTQDLPPGPDGPAGPPGIPGDQGSDGDEGEPGATGAAGPATAGPPGDQGEKGRAGSNGWKGPRGDRGVIGEKGFRGWNGWRGHWGEKGQKGREGYSGDKGDIGEKGGAGGPGDKGDVGDEGPKGDKGPVGDRGTPCDVMTSLASPTSGCGGKRCLPLPTASTSIGTTCLNGENLYYKPAGSGSWSSAGTTSAYCQYYVGGLWDLATFKPDTTYACKENQNSCSYTNAPCAPGYFCNQTVSFTGGSLVCSAPFTLYAPGTPPTTINSAGAACATATSGYGPSGSGIGYHRSAFCGFQCARTCSTSKPNGSGAQTATFNSPVVGECLTATCAPGQLMLACETNMSGFCTTTIAVSTQSIAICAEVGGQQKWQITATANRYQRVFCMGTPI